MFLELLVIVTSARIIRREVIFLQILFLFHFTFFIRVGFNYSLYRYMVMIVLCFARKRGLPRGWWLATLEQAHFVPTFKTGHVTYSHHPEHTIQSTLRSPSNPRVRRVKLLLLNYSTGSTTLRLGRHPSTLGTIHCVPVQQLLLTL